MGAPEIVRGAPPAWRDGWYVAALLAAFPAIAGLAWLTPLVFTLRWPGAVSFIMAVGVLPLLEEIVFRLGLHDALAARLRARFGALTLANVATAACFALAHVWAHPPAWALATFVPALVFGALWERHGRLYVPVSVHAFYNAAHLCLLAAGPPLS